MSNKSDAFGDPEHHKNIPLWDRLSPRAQERAFQAVGNVLLLFVIVVVLFPLYWVFSSAFRPESEAISVPTSLVPDTVILDNFTTLIFDTAFPTWTFNSIVLAIGVVTITTTAATLGGYGLSRIEFPRQKTFARAIIFGYMFPGILLAIPMFVFWSQLGIINSLFGLILALSGFSLPFSLWIMWKFFQSVPYSIEESAQMAGASRFRAFYEIALPVAKPGIVAIAIFAFAIAWNEYTIALILMPEQDMWVITVGLDSFQETDLIDWGTIMAGCAIALLPPLLFVYFLQEHLLRGFENTGLD